MPSFEIMFEKRALYKYVDIPVCMCIGRAFFQNRISKLAIGIANSFLFLFVFVNGVYRLLEKSSTYIPLYMPIDSATINKHTIELTGWLYYFFFSWPGNNTPTGTNTSKMENSGMSEAGV